MWYALPQVIPALKGPGFQPFYAAAIALSVNEGAYAAEIIRGGLLSIDDGQRRGGAGPGHAAVGPSSGGSSLPQVIRVVTPALSNDFITLLKITSLAYAVSLRELMTMAQIQVATSFQYAEWYGAAAVYYLVLVSAFMVVQAWFERRYVWAVAASRPPVRRPPRLRRLRPMSRYLPPQEGDPPLSHLILDPEVDRRAPGTARRGAGPRGDRRPSRIRRTPRPPRRDVQHQPRRGQGDPRSRPARARARCSAASRSWSRSTAARSASRASSSGRVMPAAAARSRCPRPTSRASAPRSAWCSSGSTCSRT